MSIAESGVYLIAACLPVYRSLLRVAKRDGGTTNSRITFGSKSLDGSELANLGRSGRGFSRLDRDESKSSYNGAAYTSPESDEMLVDPHTIKVQREYSVTLGTGNGRTAGRDGKV